MRFTLQCVSDSTGVSDGRVENLAGGADINSAVEDRGGIPPRARGFPGKPNRASRTWWYSGTASRADQPRTSTTRRRVGSLPRESRAAGGPSEN